MGWQSPDTIRQVIQSTLAGIVILGGLFAVYDLIIRGLVSSDAGLAIISGLVGAATAFVFQSNAITSAVTQTVKAVQNGNNPPPLP